MNKDLDLDFSSEISKAKKTEAPPPVPQATAPSVKEEVKPLNINIALEVLDGESPRLILKDLADLTGEEFLLWASRVFPVLDQKEANPRHFDTRSSKAAAFDQILRFHTTSIFHVKKELNWSKPH